MFTVENDDDGMPLWMSILTVLVIGAVGFVTLGFVARILWWLIHAGWSVL